MLSRRSLVGGAAFAAAAGLLPRRAWAADDCTLPVLTPSAALQKLREGNDSFEGGTLVPYPIDKRTLETSAICQRPIATIVCCSDSRSSPEQIFQLGIGQLFIVRNAGSTAANPQAIGSIEYSVGVLKTPLIVVLGHTRCGAAEAATKIVNHGEKFPGSIPGMVAPLLDAARETQVGTPEGWTDRTTIANVRHIATLLRSPRQPVLAQPFREGKLSILPAMYTLETGKVTFLEP